MATPCSVKAKGRRLSPIRSRLDITICDLHLVNSSGLSWNMKSGGKRRMFRRTAWLRTLVPTPYSSARSRSSITFWPRISRIDHFDPFSRDRSYRAVRSGRFFSHRSLRDRAPIWFRGLVGQRPWAAGDGRGSITTAAP